MHSPRGHTLGRSHEPQIEERLVVPILKSVVCKLANYLYVYVVITLRDSSAVHTVLLFRGELYHRVQLLHLASE